MTWLSRSWAQVGKTSALLLSTRIVWRGACTHCMGPLLGLSEERAGDWFVLRLVQMLCLMRHQLFVLLLRLVSRPRRLVLFQSLQVRRLFSLTLRQRTSPVFAPAIPCSTTSTGR